MNIYNLIDIHQSWSLYQLRRGRGKLGHGERWRHRGTMEARGGVQRGGEQDGEGQGGPVLFRAGHQQGLGRSGARQSKIHQRHSQSEHHPHGRSQSARRFHISHLGQWSNI